jgi:hypothetical protein
MFGEAFDRQPRQVIEVDGRDVGVLVVVPYKDVPALTASRLTGSPAATLGFGRATPRRTLQNPGALTRVPRRSRRTSAGRLTQDALLQGA